MNLPPWLEDRGEICVLTLLVTPGARQDRLMGEQDDALKLQIAAPPVEGEANKALVAFLARKVLKVPRSAVRLLTGERSRHKRVCVDAPAADVIVAVARVLRSG